MEKKKKNSLFLKFVFMCSCEIAWMIIIIIIPCNNNDDKK